MWDEFLNAIEFYPVIDTVQELCVTESASLRVPCWTIHVDEERCQEALDAVGEMVSFLREHGVLSLPEPLVMQDVARRVEPQGSILSLELCHALCQTLGMLDRWQRELAPLRGSSHSALKVLTERLTSLEALRREAERLVDDQGSLRSQASSELAACRREILASQEGIKRDLKQWMSREENLQVVQDTFISVERDRYIVPVKREWAQRIHGVIHRLSSSGATAFLEPMEMVSAGNRLAGLRDQERRIVHRLLADFSALVRGRRDELRWAAEVATEWDLLQAKARLVTEKGWSLPRISRNQPMELRDIWHPLLERASARRIVPVSLNLPRDQSVLLVTGPNAGGKTVLLKSVGLVVALAKTGLPVPGKEGCSIPLFEGLFADMGDEQDIVRGESTFASHLRRMKDILDHAQGRALVLVDELCTGTDPEAAAALGQAILEYLAERDCLVFCTTHLAALTAFVQERDDMKNAAMSFDSAQGEPTYRLTLGSPGGSHALDVAEKWGMPEKVVSRARERLGKDRILMESLIVQLREKEASLTQKDCALARTLRDMEKERDLYRNKRKDTEAEAHAVLSKAAKDARDLLREIRREADRLVGALRRKTGNSSAGREVIRGLQHLGERVDAVQIPAPPTEKRSSVTFQEGMEVKIRSSEKRGRILEIKEDGSVLVQADTWRLLLSSSELVPVDPRPSSSSSSSNRFRVSHVVEEVPYALDLRGMRVHEAEPVLSAYLDRVILSSFETVELLHGEGTGALKEMCREILSRHPSVDHFISNPGGRFGVTTVWLRGP